MHDPMCKTHWVPGAPCDCSARDKAENPAKIKALQNELDAMQKMVDAAAYHAIDTCIELIQAAREDDPDVDVVVLLTDLAEAFKPDDE